MDGSSALFAVKYISSVLQSVTYFVEYLGMRLRNK